MIALSRQRSAESRERGAKRRACVFLALGSLLLACSSLGCSKLVPVEGKVMLDGQPLPGATIIFFPKDRAADAKGGARSASTWTDNDGFFCLETVNRRGALPGTYQVAVSRRALPPGVPVPKFDESDPDFLAKTLAINSKKVETVPKQYTQQQTTPLEIEVPPGGKKDIIIELNSKES